MKCIKRGNLFPLKKKIETLEKYSKTFSQSKLLVEKTNEIVKNDCRLIIRIIVEMTRINKKSVRQI